MNEDGVSERFEQDAGPRVVADPQIDLAAAVMLMMLTNR